MVKMEVLGRAASTAPAVIPGRNGDLDVLRNCPGVLLPGGSRDARAGGCPPITTRLLEDIPVPAIRSETQLRSSACHHWRLAWLLKDHDAVLISVAGTYQRRYLALCLSEEASRLVCWIVLVPPLARRLLREEGT